VKIKEVMLENNPTLVLAAERQCTKPLRLCETGETGGNLQALAWFRVSDTLTP
jgi:hypothetical protein